MYSGSTRLKQHHDEIFFKHFENFFHLIFLKWFTADFSRALLWSAHNYTHDFQC